jgi:hypothetical protein
MITLLFIWFGCGIVAAIILLCLKEEPSDIVGMSTISLGPISLIFFLFILLIKLVRHFIK